MTTTMIGSSARTLEPGQHRDVPFAEYLRWPFMSQSMLKQGRDSMRHLKCAMDKECIEPPTDDMILGSALHVCFLEPEEMPNRVAKWEGPRRAGSDWEAFKEEHAGKAILTPGMHDKLIGMIKSLRAEPDIRHWSARAEAIEVSCIGEIDGVPFKGRVDALTDDPLWDLKKISSTDERTIDNTIYDYGYHIQAFCYCRLFGRKRFCLGLVESVEPYDVAIVELSPRWIELGGFETRKLLNAYKQCVAEKKWPGRSSGIRLIEPPAWVEDKFGSKGASVTIGGKSAF